MITDEKTKTAAVVDPQRDIDQYLADAQAGGYTIKYVFLTHFHADFIAGHIELRDKAGATIHLGSRAEAEFECVKMQDGDVVEFGDVKLEIMETPGHTPEGISILVYDLAKGRTEPLAVLTGDTLFIECELTSAKKRLGKASCRCLVNGEVVSEGILLFGLVDK